MEVDTSAVLSSTIVSLTVHLSRIDSVEENIQKNVVVAHRWVVVHNDCLGVTRRSGAHLAVGGIFHLAVRVAHGRVLHARNTLVSQFKSPKTSSREGRRAETRAAFALANDPVFSREFSQLGAGKVQRIVVYGRSDRRSKEAREEEQSRF